MTKIISVSGCTGAGKSTIAKELCAALGNYELVSYDENEDKIVFPDSAPGGHPNEYDVTALLELVLGKKDKGQSVVFDYPFGKANGQFSAVIDYAIFIDVPLDVSMARRTRREVLNGLEIKGSWLFDELCHWETKVRNGYIKSEKTVSVTCDLVVDGMMQPQQIVNLILKKLASEN